MAHRICFYSILACCAFCITSLSTAPVLAQDKDKTVEEFAVRYDKRFAKRDPAIGATIEDVSAFDENGDAFKLSKTRGKHTVLVFGCLT